MGRGRTVFRLVRPVTLVAPATGVLAGAAAAQAATPCGAPWGPALAGAAAAVLLNAASNTANALADRAADALNKPNRPLAAGGGTAGAALVLVACLAAGLAVGVAAGVQFLCCAVGGAAASASYSLPPLRLKRNAWTAGAAIAVARGGLLVVAGWATVGDVTATAAPWWLGACFFVFVVGAQATKDFADVAGDRAAGVATWPVALGPARAAARVGAFVTWPWLLWPAVAAAGLVGVATGPMAAGAATCGALGLAAWALLRAAPERRVGENHPAWLLMYLQLSLGHAAVAWGAWAAGPPEARLPAARLVVIGIDGLDPGLLARHIAAGDCPTLGALADASGGIRRPEPSEPPISPSVWATVATGLDPSGHRILDFVRRDAATHALRPGLVDVEGPTVLGGLVLGPPVVTNRLRGVPYWQRLCAAGIPAHGYFVPNAFPVSGCGGGEVVAGLGVPDARGTVSSYTEWDTALAEGGPIDTQFGGLQLGLRRADGRAASVLPGPWRPGREGRERVLIPLVFVSDGEGLEVTLDGAPVPLRVGADSPWMDVTFPLAPGVVLRARTQFRLLVHTPDRWRVFARAPSLVPGAAPVPLVAPAAVGRELDRHYGPGTALDHGKTVGWSEETFACQEGVWSVEETVADAARDLQRRAAIVADRLRRTHWACATAVFTEVDRVCHVAWRDEAAIRAIYREADAAVACVQAACPPGTVVLVVSDHGFRTFHTAVNLNAWLRRTGYLVLRPGATLAARSLHDLARGLTLDAVDWSQTRAYAAGLGGVYLNRRGREAHGIVDPDAAPALRRELAEALRGLARDGTPVVEAVLAADEAGFGAGDPDAPDLFVGFRDGYRVSWQSVLGGADEAVFAPNDRPWCGDHVSAPARAIPGVVLASVPLDGGPFHVRDVAPTVLRYFGVAVPGELPGRSWSISTARR